MVPPNIGWVVLFVVPRMGDLVARSLAAGDRYFDRDRPAPAGDADRSLSATAVT